VRQLRPPAGPGRPDRSLFGDLRLEEPGGARHPPPLSAADEAGAADPRPGSTPKGDWPTLAKSIAYKHLDEGLIDRGITRDLAWGIPVVKDGFPRPGMEDKVFYVWFDAPIEYIAATQEWAEKHGRDWRDWWRTDAGAEDVRYVQFMGKDNVAFHTVSFPATILGSEEPWKSVDMLKAFNWLNWYGGKFSTSQKRGVFMDAGAGAAAADYWRWYLTAYGPESSDTAFTWEQFASRRPTRTWPMCWATSSTAS
jgi:methionyl-tRNA synthetase